MIGMVLLLVGRVPRVVRIAVVVLAALGLVFTWRWMLAPPTSDIASVERVDAVVMFVGGRGERLETALELMELGVARVLVIPNGTVPTWPEANELCAGSADFEVACPEPEPNNTRGEAQVLGDLAAERGWESMAMVTSTYHVGRATLMLNRCFDGEVVAVRAAPDLSVFTWTRRVGHEWLGHIEARVLKRGC